MRESLDLFFLRSICTRYRDCFARSPPAALQRHKTMGRVRRNLPQKGRMCLNYASVGFFPIQAGVREKRILSSSSSSSLQPSAHVPCIARPIDMYIACTQCVRAQYTLFASYMIMLKHPSQPRPIEWVREATRGPLPWSLCRCRCPLRSLPPVLHLLPIPPVPLRSAPLLS